MKERFSLFQKLFDLSLDIGDLLCGLEAGHYLSLLVDEELGEVPFDVGLLLIFGISLAEHIRKDEDKE